MQIIETSPEYHFLAALEKCKVKASAWTCLHFSMSRQLKHEYVLEKIDQFDRLLKSLHKQSNTFFHHALEKEQFENGYAYQFCDGDILFLIQAETDNEKNLVRRFFNNLSQEIDANLCDYGLLDGNFSRYNRIADQKIFAEQRIASYRLMTDKNRLSSISARRKRREDPLVMVVEDDRFTAAYATRIINKLYDVAQARCGEEAITQYIEKAPDILMLDVHLPGLDGHQTLQAIQKIDPHAFIVMLSADTSPENVLHSTKSGAETFLMKPLSKDRLLNTIRKSPHIKMREYRVKETIRI